MRYCSLPVYDFIVILKYRYIYKPTYPIYPMVKEDKKLILQVKESKNKQKRVTIPKESKIKGDDYVEVKKVEWTKKILYK